MMLWPDATTFARLKIPSRPEGGNDDAVEQRRLRQVAPLPAAIQATRTSSATVWLVSTIRLTRCRAIFVDNAPPLVVGRFVIRQLVPGGTRCRSKTSHSATSSRRGATSVPWAGRPSARSWSSSRRRRRKGRGSFGAEAVASRSTSSRSGADRSCRRWRRRARASGRKGRARPSHQPPAQEGARLLNGLGPASGGGIVERCAVIIAGARDLLEDREGPAHGLIIAGAFSIAATRGRNAPWSRIRPDARPSAGRAELTASLKRDRTSAKAGKARPLGNHPRWPRRRRVGVRARLPRPQKRFRS